ncbi:MAG: stage II sporulation protein M, partial [Deltaproteobacteria bacterium]|nr:stage II sporulation protein M [Deltaproteobacteria bacterium]
MRPDAPTPGPLVSPAGGGPLAQPGAGGVPPWDQPGAGSARDLRSARFRRGREESWDRLDRLVTKLEKKGLGSLTANEAVELPMLYQAGLSSLAVARGTILDRNLLDYLEGLSLRAYLVVYGPRASILEVSARFISEGLPRAVWALRFHVLVSFLILSLATVAGFLAVISDPGNFPDLVPPELASGRDFEATTAELAQSIFGNWKSLEEALIHFANSLFRHNTMAAILCFSLGFCLGVPTVLVLISNGLTLGAMIGLFQAKGLGLEFLGWLSIHGTTEISAIVLAGAAGLGVAEKILLPGQGPRLANLSRHGRDAAAVMVGVVMMLLVAGILEGCFRQLIDDTALRFLVALAALAFWLWYFSRGGRAAGDAPAFRD